MAPAKALRSISQQAFNEMVNENVEDLDMDPAEALHDAIQTLTLQGVDLSGIVTCVPGENSITENPVIQSIVKLKQLSSNWTDLIVDDGDLGEVLDLLNELADLCRVEGSGNAAIATRNGGVELVCLILSKLGRGCRCCLTSALNAMALLLHDLQSSESFKKSEGPKMLMGILNDGIEDTKLLNSGFSVVAAAATANEVLKESYMDLKIDELIAIVLKKSSRTGIPSLYDAIRILLSADDNRVVASQVYGYARKFAKMGITESLVDSLRQGISSPSLVSASIALKAVAVNDEICRAVAENGGIDAILCCIDDSGEQGNNIVAKACCSLLSKLAGSDSNKNAVVGKSGMDRLIKLSARFSDDPSVIQEVMSIICTLSLRSPENASRAIEAGAGDLAKHSMQKFPLSASLQKNSCLMIRNLVVRNPENRSLLLSNGIEKIIRKAKENHQSCKEAATDALRDLGLDNYNS